MAVRASGRPEASDEEIAAPFDTQSTDTTPTAVPEDSTLPRPDGGIGAWLFLVGAAIFEIVGWGFPYSYGVFYAYFFTHEPFKGIEYVSVAGVISNGVQQMCLPFVIYFINYFPKQRKNTMWLGCLFCVVSPIGGAFSKTPTQLIICLGPMYGLGAGMLFAPTMSYMGEWFVKRKSLAYGFICGMGGLSGSVLPLIFTTCLERYGYKATLIGWAIAVFVLTAFGLLFMRPRLPSTKTAKPSTSDFDFLRKPLFLVLLTATIIQGLAHYVPSIYLPTYGLDFGLTPTQGALLASLLNLATAIGQPLQGMLADYRSSFYIPMVLSTFGSGLEALLIWGFSRNLWSLVIFSLLYGASAGGFAVLRPRFSSAIVGNDNDKEQSLLIFGILTAVRGGSIIASGFIASAQLDESARVTNGYGAGKWLQIIVFTGVTMIVASTGALGMFIKPSRKFCKSSSGPDVAQIDEKSVHV